jgi:hypothetical protein
MKTITITPDTRIRTKGFDISIGKQTHQIALISLSTDEFTPFTAIRKGGRLAKIKRIFKCKIADSTCFFFEHMTEQDTLKLIGLLK